jgi:hypothetical protein
MGASMVEAVMALVLGLFVVHLGLTTAIELRRYGIRLAVRQDALLSLRIARYVLRRELGHADPARDWTVDGDSLSLRAFRGTALVCGDQPRPSEWVVAYRGDRAPDPSKDSIEATYPDGAVRYAALTGVGAPGEPCQTPDSTESALLLRIDPPLPTGAILARVFERGSYHLSGSALRYRRGAGGRQPLTPEVWSDVGTGWRVGVAWVAIDLEPTSPQAGRPWGGFLAWLAKP